MSEITPETIQPKEFSIDNESKLQQGLTGVDAFGYQMAGISLLDQPNTTARLAGVGLIAKGVMDHYDALTDFKFNEGGVRERSRNMFFSFAERLSKVPGESLSARLKRNIGESALTHKDKELRYRFNRMMGGMFLSMAGFEMAINAGSTGEKVAGTIAASVGIAENLKGVSNYSERTRELELNQTSSAKRKVHQ